MSSMWKFSRKKVSRGSGNGGRRSSGEGVIQHDDPERNQVRGHALFVRFMERKGLGHCVRYFPETMTLGQLRRASPKELVSKFNIASAKDRESILKVIQDSHKGEEPTSDVEVAEVSYYKTLKSETASTQFNLKIKQSKGLMKKRNNTKKHWIMFNEVNVSSSRVICKVLSL